MAIECASHGFHVFRKYWRAKLTDKLTVLFEKSNVCDPYACGIYVESMRENISAEISTFCKFFLDYGGLINTCKCYFL